MCVVLVTTTATRRIYEFVCRTTSVAEGARERGSEGAKRVSQHVWDQALTGACGTTHMLRIKRAKGWGSEVVLLVTADTTYVVYE